MCGIAGIAGNNIIDKKVVVKAMTDAIAHRGPDGDSMWATDNCILGHRRLSIIDLSTGDQPMFSADKKKAITFNGEIYGYKEIRSSLTGYPFHTTSDTEVVLALYEKYEENSLEHLPGMFAFALWDENKQQLFCGRDRFGEKPFYYAITPDGHFVYASEIKAIIASGLIRPQLSTESVLHYLQHLYVHPHHTIYSNVFTLPPAHYLTFRNGKCNVKRYWHLPKTFDAVSLDEATETFRDLFERSIQKQLIADVPVGAFLSGGIDSSLVVAIAAKYKKHIKTISFGFGNEINELPYAKLIADKFDTDHVEIQQHLPDLEELLFTMQDIYDEPFADSSNIPTYLISKAAAQHLKVVLTGDGGDELMGGYSFWYRHLFNIENADLFSGYKKALLPYAARIAGKAGNTYLPFLRQQQAVLSKGKRTVRTIHAEQNNYFNNSQLQQLGFPAEQNVTNGYSFEFESTVSDAMKMDIENYMPGDILVKTDRAAMASSLELRAPFLDKDLASFCISLPYNLKLNYNEEKIIAKQAFQNLLPANIVKRRKQGFGAPVTSWLQSSSLQQLKREYLQSPNKKIFGLLDFDQAQKIIKEDNYHTWILLVLSLWLEKH
jgi:asparagine synthase (glutamine-hydrolysing)